MNNTMTALLAEPTHATFHRYQVYRQARNGLHYNHGATIASAEDAVALFLQTSPAFEGGGLQLWGHVEQRNVASADWHTETTRMGFTVQLRSNRFHDPALALIARQIAEREEFAQRVSEGLSLKRLSGAIPLPASLGNIQPRSTQPVCTGSTTKTLNAGETGLLQ